MKFDHQEIFLLFISVAAGYYAGNLYLEFPFSLIASAIIIVIVYYTAELLLKKIRAE
ncbi:MAG: hypothetical protein JXQ82_04620 [Methanomicrobiaceae archaeon]|nr:hypothetical protein [Methanomicrobiaceae archaeon]